MTPAQQQLADVAQAGEANACCLALGGEIGTYPVTGEELCLIAGGNSFPLGDACGQITASLPSMPPPGEEQSGGFFNWLGNNFTEVTSGIANVVDSFTGNAPVTPPPIQPAGSGTTQITPGVNNQDNTIYYIVGGAMLLLVVILLIRKKK
mgnify:CR=1 FL=1